MAQEDSFPSFDNFKKYYNKKISQLILRKISNDLETPLSAFLKIAIDRFSEYLTDYRKYKNAK